MDLKCIKRDGTIKPFSFDRIEMAIKNAYEDVYSELDKKEFREIEDIMDNIINYISFQIEDDSISVEEIQNLVVDEINQVNRIVAKAYEDYMNERTKARERNQELYKNIIGLIDGTNESVTRENGNKNPTLVSTQRDLVAGLVSKSMSKYLFPKEIWESHIKGAIHIHDLDYYANCNMYNCFSGDTLFISDKGTKTFEEVGEGSLVKVPTHTGKWKTAVVKKYPKNTLYEYTFKRQNNQIKTIKATKDHRWILEDSTVTTTLSIGDKLIETPIIEKYDFDNCNTEQKIMWCYGFAIGDGCDVYNSVNNYGIKIRLCGKKTSFANRFIEAGFNVSYPNSYNGDAYVWIGKITKSQILNKEYYNNLDLSNKISLFNGLISADGHFRNEKYARGIQVSNKEVKDLVINLAELSGYYIGFIQDLTGKSTNLVKERKDTWLIHFNRRQYRAKWKLINKVKLEEDYTWCLEVEDDKSFILSGGIVTGNCCLVNLKDMLDNGTVINGKLIETPHTLRTAMNIATQISAVVSSSQYGGQTMDISHLSPYLRKSMKIINNKYNNMRHLFKEGNDEIIKDLINKEIKKEIVDSVQLMMYQFSTISGTNGQQPFISLALYINSDEEYKKETAMLIEEIFNQRIQGMKNENGVNEVMAFPKLLYFLDENNIYEGSEYYWLTELGAKCCSLTMNPDFISVKQMKKNNGFAYPPMGCRAFISVMEDNEGNKINDFFGRGNAGVCTLNFPFIALESIRDNKNFYDVLDKYLDMVREVGKSRWRKLEGVTTSVAPLLWEHGAISRKPKGTYITDIMEERGFTTTIGYSGIWETVFALTGKKLTEKDGLEKGLEILKYIDSVKTTWNKEEPKYRFAIYGCPSENTTDKFARSLKKEFGEVKGVSDRDFVTNSFHIHVEENIDAFEKLNIEANFVPYSLGGVVNYIEVDNMSKNVPAVIKIMQHIYETINYAEINQELDICNECLFRGAMARNEELSRWECPNCGNTDQDTISVTRRLCGYINSSKEWSRGRTKDILSRVKHL